MASRKFPIQVPIIGIDRFSQVFGKLSGTAGKIGKRISSAGKTLTLGMSVPLAALAATSVRTGLQFQKSLNRVQATTQASAEEMAALRQQAQDLAGQTHSLTETAEAMSLLAEKGEDVLSIQKQAPSVLRLATIANVDLAEAVELQTDSLELWGKTADDAAAMTDLLAAASQRTNLANLMEGLRVAGPRARATGQDLRELISILDILADEGFEGAKGGAAVTAALSAMVKPGRIARRELEQLGIRRSQLQTAEGGVRSLAEIIELLEKRGATATQVLRIFGEGGPAVAALIEKGLVPAVRSGAESLEDVEGRSQDIVNVLRSGGVDSVSRFATAWEKVGLSLAESGLLDVLQRGIELVGGLVKKFDALDPSTKRNLVTLGGVAAVLGPVIVVIGNLVTIVGGLVGVLKLVGPASAGLVGIAGKVVPVIAAFVGLYSILSDVYDLANTIAGRVDPAGGGPKVDRPAMDAAAFAHQRGATGEPVNEDRVRAARDGKAEHDAQTGEASGRLEVDFRNVPKGTKIKGDSAGGLELGITAGFNLAGAL